MISSKKGRREKRGRKQRKKRFLGSEASKKTHKTGINGQVTLMREKVESYLWVYEER